MPHVHVNILSFLAIILSSFLLGLDFALYLKGLPYEGFPPQVDFFFLCINLCCCRITRDD